MVVGVLRRVGLVQTLKDRPVAEGAGVGAAARGDHRRAVALFVGKQRQMIGVRKAGQLFVSGEGQFVEIENAVTTRVDADLAALIAIDQVADAGQRLAVGQIKHRSFAFTDDQVIELGKMFEDRCTERGYMDIADGNLDVRTLLLDVQRHVGCVHETGSRCRKSDQLGIGRQNDLGVGFDSRRRIGPQAIVQLHLMAEFLQPAGQLHDPDRWHAVGQH